MKRHYPFEPQPLPYEYAALEPYIDEATLHYHHDKHYITYVNNLNAALEAYPEYHSWTVEMLLHNLEELPEALRTPIRRQGGGVYNHELYFSCMRPDSQPSKPIEDLIAKQFGSFQKWQERMTQAALSVFGSGYAMLTIDKDQELQIMTAANQDTPLHLEITPLLLIDVWEHAYYLKYQNRRNDYTDNWFHIINWQYVESLYTSLFEDD